MTIGSIAYIRDRGSQGAANNCLQAANREVLREFREGRRLGRDWRGSS